MTRQYTKIGLATILWVLLAAPAAWADDPQPPPAGLTGTEMDASVLLNWDHVGPEVEFYRIYRSTTPGEPGQMVRRLKPFYITGDMHGRPADGALTNDQTYYYSVQSEAFDGTLGPIGDPIALTPRRNYSVPVPRIVGTWKQVAPHSPTGYEWDNGSTDNACDFSIWQAADGTWQLVSCIRSTTHPGRTRLFYRWEGQNITDGNWSPKGVFATAIPDPPYNEVEGRMQAPQVFRYENAYYMSYNSAGAHMMRSEDGKNFTRIPNDAGSYQIFSSGRDIGMLDNRDVDGRWYAYWVDNQPGMHLTRSVNDNLLGSWQDMGHRDHPGFFESPFVQRYGGLYYLFVPMYVVVSDDPNDFNKPVLTYLSDANGNTKAATEIIRDQQNDKWYIAGYGNGIYVAELEWQPVPEPATISLLAAGALLLRRSHR